MLDSSLPSSSALCRKTNLLSLEGARTLSVCSDWPTHARNSEHASSYVEPNHNLVPQMLLKLQGKNWQLTGTMQNEDKS